MSDEYHSYKKCLSETYLYPSYYLSLTNNYKYKKKTRTIIVFLAKCSGGFKSLLIIN